MVHYALNIFNKPPLMDSLHLTRQKTTCGKHTQVWLTTIYIQHNKAEKQLTVTIIVLTAVTDFTGKVR